MSTVTQQTFNLHDEGSNPSDLTEVAVNKWREAPWFEQLSYKQQGEGSIPSTPINNQQKRD